MIIKFDDSSVERSQSDRPSSLTPFFLGVLGALVTHALVSRGPQVSTLVVNVTAEEGA